jgi:hypothetical protein
MAAMEAAADAMLASASRAFSSALAIAIQIQVSPRPPCAPHCGWIVGGGAELFRFSVCTRFEG